MFSSRFVFKQIIVNSSSHSYLWFFNWFFSWFFFLLFLLLLIRLFAWCFAWFNCCCRDWICWLWWFCGSGGGRCGSGGGIWWRAFRWWLVLRWRWRLRWRWSFWWCVWSRRSLWRCRSGRAWSLGILGRLGSTFCRWTFCTLSSRGGLFSWWSITTGFFLDGGKEPRWAVIWAALFTETVLWLNQTHSPFFVVVNRVIGLHELVSHDPVVFSISRPNLHIIRIQHQLALAWALILHPRLLRHLEQLSFCVLAISEYFKLQRRKALVIFACAAGRIHLCFILLGLRGLSTVYSIVLLEKSCQHFEILGWNQSKTETWIQYEMLGIDFQLVGFALSETDLAHV